MPASHLNATRLSAWPNPGRLSVTQSIVDHRSDVGAVVVEWVVCVSVSTEGVERIAVIVIEGQSQLDPFRQIGI